MIYTLKTKDGKYIHSNSVLCGKWISIYVTSNLEEARLVNWDTVKRYQTIVNRKVGERVKVWDGVILDGGWTLEETEIIGVEFNEVELTKTGKKKK